MSLLCSTKKLKYHQVLAQVVEVKKHEGAGRPKRGAAPKTVGYQVSFELSKDEKKIDALREKKGRFILGTNQLDENQLPPDALLKEYKAQSGTERGFKFIKNDTFQVDSVFLKTPERIEALMMVMTLCLMVYGVSEYELRQSLVEKGETIPNQTKKETQRPTMQWVYFLFRVVNELQIQFEGGTKKIVVNLNALLKRILRHFGRRAQEIYLDTS